MNDQISAIVGLLPASGEMTYEAWMKAINNANIPASWRVIQRARKIGAVRFRTESGKSSEHFVSRGSAGQG